MSEARHRAEADSLVAEVLKHGTNTARRSLFVSAAAFGAAAALPLAGATPAQAQARAPSSRTTAGCSTSAPRCAAANTGTSRLS